MKETVPSIVDASELNYIKWPVPESIKNIHRILIWNYVSPALLGKCSREPLAVVMAQLFLSCGCVISLKHGLGKRLQNLHCWLISDVVFRFEIV